MRIPDGMLVQSLVRAQSGDRSGAEAVLVTLYPAISRFLSRRFGRDARVVGIIEDLVQESMLRVAEQMNQCTAQHDGQVVIWALTVARRVALEQFRNWRSGIVLSTRVIDLRSDLLPAPVDAESEPGYAGDPESPSVAVLLCRFAVEAQNELPEGTMDLLWARLMDEASWKEIGERFGTTEGAVKTRFQRVQRDVRRKVLDRVARLPTQDRTRVEAYLTRISS
jgi:RNA polymerase sigma factor (sigma-70 family)